MKKKVLSGLFALALLITTGDGVQKSMKNDVGLSDCLFGVGKCGSSG
ncbi:MAG: hypothetical protein PHC64_10240 [Candidatus Gastranaerophilales bacterium]|nr:hypothetical protein [Candidatus Gastranaerophilales bacterium]